jgi:ankyrin repeat protein
MDRRAVVEILLAHGADVRARSANGSTPLHLAAGRDHVEIARMLLDRDAQANSADNSGSTPLDEAAWRGHADMARLLIARGARVNVHNQETGATPLHRRRRRRLRTRPGRRDRARRSPTIQQHRRHRGTDGARR